MKLSFLLKCPACAWLPSNISTVEFGIAKQIFSLILINIILIICVFYVSQYDKSNFFLTQVMKIDFFFVILIRESVNRIRWEYYKISKTYSL